MLWYVLYPVCILRFFEYAARHLFACGLGAALALAQPGVSPFEAFGHDVADVGEVEQEHGNTNNGVKDGHNSTPRGFWSYISVTLKV